MAISNKRIVAIFIILSVVYMLEVILIPPDSTALAKFKLSETEAKLLGLSVALPIVLIWMLGCFVYTKFATYVKSIENDRDGKALSLVSYGLLFLCLWLPLSTAFSNISNYLYRTEPSWTVPLVIINNYLNLFLVAVGLALIYKGSYELTKLRESKGLSAWKYVALAPLILISGLFIYLSLNNIVRQFPSADVPVAAYYLPDWLLVATIIIPYILVFYYGIFSVVYLYAYRRKVRGIIYKGALDYFAKGLACIVVSIVLIRYLASLTTAFNDATLKIVLLVIYLLLALLLLGFVLLVKSVKRLQAIEKV